ncbi:4F2 cell-surface antigen heavy chain-like [Anoplophora glabripennis]|uniref:4F2 cell-surface antigen heavy chain-like n=1 Tax=Anoplophora glabripennis TaxID=217634 RepID=UPI000873FAC2|nr:4F2 cell-surface antigen heavy chain-like [Anoplophora glabripennis]
MEGFLRVDNTNLPGSPTNSFLADEVASICPLITPSPPTNDLINPLPEPTQLNLGIGHELATKLQHVQDDDKAESSSSSSSALAAPACAQLLNHRNIYHHIVKDEDTEVQETNGKVQPLQLTFRNPPDNYFFMSWNWPLIRKIALWIFMSGLVAMVALVVAMISTLPKACNPQIQWYQGNVFYEIFPASFYADQDMVGNLKGISQKAKYFVKLGVKGVRLNPIFPTPDYPRDFENITDLVRIDPSLGTFDDFRRLVERLKSKNISLILDLPVHPLVKRLPHRKTSIVKNETNIEPPKDIIEGAILHWISYGVDGFYLKGLENLVDDPNFASSLRIWKKILGPDRIIIVNETVINESPKSIINIVLNNVDLVDIKLDLSNGANAVTQYIGSLQNGTLFSKPSMPWIHWSLGNANSRRLINILQHYNTTLGATLLQLMLPGTPSIFYGDEIGLHEILDPDGEKQDIKHLHQLNMMPWQGYTPPMLNWIHSKLVPPNYEQVEPVSKMIEERNKSPSIYMNSVYKEGVNKPNTEVKYVGDFLVVQRWYPRRKAYVVVCNLGHSKQSADLSMLLYSGDILVGPRADSVSDTISFKEVSLCPGESVVIKLN